MRHRRRLTFALHALLVLGLASAAAAQDPDPVAEAPIRIGIFGVAPRLAITSLGVDTNVFNEADDPREDSTVQASSGAEVWMRAGRGLVTANAGVEVAYFKEYDSERSIGAAGSVRYEHRFNRLAPFVSYAASNTRQRPGDEIDVRARAIAGTLRGGFGLRLGTKAEVALGAQRETLDYDDDVEFGGRRLRQALNRTRDAVDLSWRQRLTVLTTWVVRASTERERFEFSRERNGDSIRVATGVELGGFGPFRGHAFVGLRHLTSIEGRTLPEFTGVTADVDVAYTAPTRTRLDVHLRRDLHYALAPLAPYYIQTGVRGTLTQVVTGSWDVQLHGGHDGLQYRSAVTRNGDGRIDRIERLGGGIGYQLAPELRVGIDVESFRRRSEVPGRGYRGVRAGLMGNYSF